MRLAFGIGTGAYEDADGFGEAFFTPQLLFTDVNAARVTYLQMASRNICFSVMRSPKDRLQMICFLVGAASSRTIHNSQCRTPCLTLSRCARPPQKR